jgi:predicted nucleotidyltransferase
MYYELVLKTLRKNKVEFIIAGGMALNLYGIPRFTKDLDILINESLQNIKKLTKTLNELGFEPKAPVKMGDFLNPTYWPIWKKEKGMMALNFYNSKKPFEEIDLLVYSPLKYKDAKKRKTHVRIENIDLDLVSLNDLIKMKRHAGREQDKSDIEAIKRLKAYLNKK